MDLIFLLPPWRTIKQRFALKRKDLKISIEIISKISARILGIVLAPDVNHLS